MIVLGFGAVGLTYRLWEKQITESEFKIVCANLLVQAQSLLSLFL